MTCACSPADAILCEYVLKTTGLRIYIYIRAGVFVCICAFVRVRERENGSACERACVCLRGGV